MKKQKSFAASLGLVALVTAALLAIPLVAMAITNEVNWSLYDFLFAGILIFGAGALYVFIRRQSESMMYRIASGLALLSALFLIWSNLAVGIIGSEDNVANYMYFGVVLILIIGVALSRFRPQGMALALFSTALAQGSTILFALAAGMHRYSGSSIQEIIMVNGFFIVLFTTSGVLFWLESNAQKTDEISQSDKI
ncbi:hypothetical protein [Rhodohalobacter sp. 8-1]|uniref:hypothetical protein n=1 Tax=Rhodohalobacter sp. 8-1 TaxID=3131972 RepID=UPI0030EF352C